MELHGKIAVVTGASSGIGAATAKALAREGMTVYAVARRRERLTDLSAEDGRIVAHPADVTDGDAVAGIAARVRAAHGVCHLLVNGAGARGPRRFKGPEDKAAVAALMDLNFFGVVRCMAAFADLLRAEPPSRVVNVASVAGKIGIGSPAYSASKFALVGFSEAVAPAWEKSGVTVTQLNPGFVVTEGFPQQGLQASPLTRRLLSSPDKVAEAIIDVARSGKRERTVPRWYRPLVTARHVAAPVFWPLARRML